jgi:hypothetical protein
MDTDRLRELLPHYVAMLGALFLAIALVRVAVGETSFWMEMGVALVIAVAYRPVVHYLGVAPDAWTEG